MFWKPKIITPKEITKIPINSNLEIFTLNKNKDNTTIKIGAVPRAIG